MYANGAGMYEITRHLEKHNIPTKKGRKLWRASQIRYMLKNETYVGRRFYNTMSLVKEPSSKIRKIKYGKAVYKDKSDWIGVNVLAIISPKLFDKAQERRQKNCEQYRQPIKHQLLSGLIECGECGCSYSSYRRRVKKKLTIGITRVYHKVAYKCNTRSRKFMHTAKNMIKCDNKEVISALLEDKVFEMIKETMTDPKKLKARMTFFNQKNKSDQKKVTWKLMRLEKKEKNIDTQKKQLVDRYITSKITQKEYINKNLELDRQLLKVKTDRAKLIKNVPLLHKKEVVDLNIRKFCANAKAKLEKANNNASKRQFLLEHVEKVVYLNYKVTIHGSVPIKLSAYEDPDQTSSASKIEFKIAGEIDKGTLHTQPRQRFAKDGRLKAYQSSNFRYLTPSTDSG